MSESGQRGDSSLVMWHAAMHTGQGHSPEHCSLQSSPHLCADESRITPSDVSAGSARPWSLSTTLLLHPWQWPAGTAAVMYTHTHRQGFMPWAQPEMDRNLCESLLCLLELKLNSSTIHVSGASIFSSVNCFPFHCFHFHKKISNISGTKSIFFFFESGNFTQSTSQESN